MRAPRWLPALCFGIAVAVLCVADGLHPEIDWVGVAVSRLANESNGWLVPLGIVWGALGTAAGAAVVRRDLRGVPGRGIRAAQAFLLIGALALLVCAVIPADRVGYRVMSWREVVHGGAGWVAMLGFPFAAFALRHRYRAWWLLGIVALSSLLTVFIVVEWIGLTQSPYSFGFGRHRTTFGLIERATIYLDFLWLALASLHRPDSVATTSEERRQAA